MSDSVLTNGVGVLAILIVAVLTVRAWLGYDDGDE